MTEEQKDQMAMELKKEREELDKYKSDLLKVHNQLKPQAELFNALKDQGISTLEDLQAKLSSQQDKVEKEPDKVEMPTSTGGDDEKFKKLEEVVKKQQEMLQRQDDQMRTDRLLSEIRTEIKDKPEYSLLQKGLTEQIAFNILRSREIDKSKNVNRDLGFYLDGVEKELRDFYTKLGGKIEPEKKQDEGGLFGASDTETKTQEEAKDSSQKSGVIDFPTLPAGGSGETPKVSAVDQIKEMGKNPITGKFDEKQAFEKFLSKSMEEGKI